MKRSYEYFITFPQKVIKLIVNSNCLSNFIKSTFKYHILEQLFFIYVLKSKVFLLLIQNFLFEKEYLKP